MARGEMALPGVSSNAAAHVVEDAIPEKREPRRRLPPSPTIARETVRREISRYADDRAVALGGRERVCCLGVTAHKKSPEPLMRTSAEVKFTLEERLLALAGDGGQVPVITGIHSIVVTGDQ
jgi:hypothetical protein